MRCSHLGAALAATFATVVTLAAPRPGHACGPDFPTALLLDRGTALGQLPAGWFLTEVDHLVSPARAYPVVSDRGPEPDDAGSRERALYERGDYRGVLALPAAQRRHRSTWAAYMLGREGSGRDAIARYRQVRALVDAGFEDTAGLAASSLGQEARLHLGEGDTVTALRLYAEQAALGHPDGGTSLLFVTRDLIDGQREGEVLGDRLGQRLLSIYLATHGAELDPAQAQRLWDALSARPQLDGADQLAAWAYRNGRFEQAAALLRPTVTGPTADWVRAKLALRDGDRAAADRLLARAAAGFSTRATCAGESTTDDGSWLLDLSCSYDRTIARVVGERVVLAIDDGRFAEALALAWGQRRAHPDDAAYVAERLVDVESLRAFVERVAPEPVDGEPTPWGLDEGGLRALLGRRLMRAGRFVEAAPYLPGAYRADAVALATSLAAARSGGDRFDRAAALYAASRLTRRHGLELLGTAHAPDWGLYEGNYDRSSTAEWAVSWEGPDESARWGWHHERGVAELTRLALTAPPRPERFHYRHVAAELADQARQLLPEGSQARRAVRCWSLRYTGAIHDSCDEPDFAAARTYRPPERRYLGPPRAPLWKRLAHRVFGRGADARRHAYASAAGLVALLAVGVGLLVARRRWRRFSPRP